MSFGEPPWWRPVPCPTCGRCPTCGGPHFPHVIYPWRPLVGDGVAPLTGDPLPFQPFTVTVGDLPPFDGLTTAVSGTVTFAAGRTT